MNDRFNKALNFTWGPAICYSGFRDGQSPDTGTFPSYQEIREDLHLLHQDWRYLRLYDCDPHAEKVLQIIRDEQLDFQVLLGAYIAAEENNNDCPWGGTYSQEELANNQKQNDERMGRLIELAQSYPDAVFALSVGNEATVSWTDHMVPVERVVSFVQRVQTHCSQPVTFCENYVPWLDKLKPLAQVVDFISIHTYPVWEYKGIDEAMDFTRQNYQQVAQAYPTKPVVITEAGWATNSNGRGIDPSNVNEGFQKTYIRALEDWSRKAGILTFVFEAFDENWKGSSDALEPEKHWGLYRADRSPKSVIQEN